MSSRPVGAFSETLSQKEVKCVCVWGGQLGLSIAKEYLPSKHEALDSTLSTKKRREGGKDKIKKGLMN